MPPKSAIPKSFSQLGSMASTKEAATSNPSLMVDNTEQEDIKVLASFKLARSLQERLRQFAHDNRRHRQDVVAEALEILLKRAGY